MGAWAELAWAGEKFPGLSSVGPGSQESASSVPGERRARSQEETCSLGTACCMRDPSHAASAPPGLTTLSPKIDLPQACFCMALASCQRLNTSSKDKGFLLLWLFQRLDFRF